MKNWAARSNYRTVRPSEQLRDLRHLHLTCMEDPRPRYWLTCLTKSPTVPLLGRQFDETVPDPRRRNVPCTPRSARPTERSMLESAAEPLDSVSQFWLQFSR